MDSAKNGRKKKEKKGPKSERIKPTRVLRVYPPGESVDTTNGQVFICDGNHSLSVRHRLLTTSGTQNEARADSAGSRGQRLCSTVLPDAFPYSMK